MLLLNLFAAFVMSDAMIKENKSLVNEALEGLRILPDEVMFEAIKDTENLASYIVRDEKFGDKGTKVEHDGRTFLVSNVKDIEKVLRVLERYQAPTKEVVEIMRSGDKPTTPYPRNFVVYFLEESGFNITLPGNRKIAEMYVSTDPSLAAEVNVPFPGVYGYNAADNLSYILPFTHENFRNIVPMSTLPIIGFTSLNNSSLYQSFDGKLFYLFFDLEHAESVKAGFSGSLDELRYEMKMLLVPNLNQHVNIGKYGLKKEDLPGCVSIHEDGGKFVQRHVSAENIKMFVRNVLDQKAELFYNSQDEPEDNAVRDVKTITRNNIGSYLENTARDRLLVFGTARCPHCVELRPILEALGGIVRKHADDKMTIGYCDVDENDMNDFEVQYVPTLLLYKAGSNEIVPYSGGKRTLENIAAFIHENGGLSLDLLQFVPDVVDEAGNEAVVPEADKEEERKAEL